MCVEAVCKFLKFEECQQSTSHLIGQPTAQMKTEKGAETNLDKIRQHVINCIVALIETYNVNEYEVVIVNTIYLLVNSENGT